jgi:hypothetical protein
LNSLALIFLSFSQKIRKSVGSNKDVKLASREPNGFIAFSCFMAPERAKMYQILQAGMIL